MEPPSSGIFFNGNLLRFLLLILLPTYYWSKYLFYISWSICESIIYVVNCLSSRLSNLRLHNPTNYFLIIVGIVFFYPSSFYNLSSSLFCFVFTVLVLCYFILFYFILYLFVVYDLGWDFYILWNSVHSLFLWLLFIYA